MEKIRNWASNNRKLFIICVVILLVLVVVLIKGISYYANKPDSISAEYVGTISDNYTCNEDDFKVVAHYNDGSKKSIQDFDISQSHPIRIGEQSTATISYYGCKTKVDIDASSVMDSNNEVQMDSVNITKLMEKELSTKLGREVKFSGYRFLKSAKLGKHLELSIGYWTDDDKVIKNKNEIPGEVSLDISFSKGKMTKQEEHDATNALMTFAYTVQGNESYKAVVKDVKALQQQLLDAAQDDEFETDQLGVSEKVTADGYIGDIYSEAELGYSDGLYLSLVMDED
jgi:hypothetical protein